MFLDIFNIFGLILNLVGTVFLSLGLIRSQEEIRDEESTYYGNNPYTTRGALRAQPYYNIGFRLLLTGFAINLAVATREILPVGKSLEIVLLATVLTLLGLLFTQFLQEKKRASHLFYRETLHTGHYITMLEGLLGESQEKSRQETWKDERSFLGYRDVKATQSIESGVRLPAKKAQAALEFVKQLRKTKDFPSFIEAITEHLQEVREWGYKKKNED